MPPYLSDSEGDESESDHAMIQPRNTVRTTSIPKRTNGTAVTESKRTRDSSEDAEDASDDDDDIEEVAGGQVGGDGDEEEAEEYIVEKILNHEWVAAEKRYKYQTKWLDYNDPKDYTWEPKENLEGAIETLQEYFDSIGGEPQPPTSSAKGSKKRGRQSTTTSTPVNNQKKPRTSSGRGRPKGSMSNELQDPSAWGPGGPSHWDPPDAKKDAWEDMIVQIETIEPDDKGNKWAFIQWAEPDNTGRNRKTKERLSLVYLCAPQKMLAFYEKHLVFGSVTRSETEND